MMVNNLKISIITVCYNSANTIEDTIKSVVNQDYINIEYIIVDGASKDDTLKIVNKYKQNIAIVISEPDNGIYDAINKGIMIASGNVVGLIHADDFLANNTVISTIANAFNSNKIDAVYSDLQYIDKQNPDKIFRRWISGNYKPNAFKWGWMPPHPTFYVKREVYLKYGLYNLTFTLSADYEFMLRFICKNKIVIAYIPEVLIKMRVGGMSNLSLKNRFIANQEDRRAWKVNNLTPFFFTRFLKPLSKLIQYFT